MFSQNLAEACKNYDFSYIAGWLNGRYSLSIDADTIRCILDPAFVFERKLMESDIEFARQKAKEIKDELKGIYKSKRWDTIFIVLHPDKWSDETWKIYLMNRLGELHIFPRFSGKFSFNSQEPYEYGKTASSKIFNTNLFPAPINRTAEKVSGIKKREKV